MWLQSVNRITLFASVSTIALIIGVAIGTRIPIATVLPVVTITTTTMTQILSNTSSNTNREMYQLRFNQTGVCSPPIYFIPWSITLSNGQYIAEPPHSNFSECCAGSSSYTNFSSIVFSVQNGNYTFQTNGASFLPNAGNVTVDGRDVTVLLKVAIPSCGSLPTQVNTTVTSA